MLLVLTFIASPAFVGLEHLIPLLSIISSRSGVANRDSAELLRECLASLSKLKTSVTLPLINQLFTEIGKRDTQNVIKVREGETQFLTQPSGHRRN